MCIRDRDKGVQHLCFIGQRRECGGFKKEIGKPGKADRLFRLMGINGVCHIVFCGRLAPRFLGQTVVSIACPCSVLAKPCTSRTFQPLTVHTRPHFPFTFCFLPPVNSGGTAGTVFRPVGDVYKRQIMYCKIDRTGIRLEQLALKGLRLP